jgi:hypothetical protein
VGVGVIDAAGGTNLTKTNEMKPTLLSMAMKGKDRFSPSDYQKLITAILKAK